LASAAGAKHRTLGGAKPQMFFGERRRREARDFRGAKPQI
jgi:hypothetical protein